MPRLLISKGWCVIISSSTASIIVLAIIISIISVYLRITRKNRIKEYVYIDYADNIDNVVLSYSDEYIKQMNAKYEEIKINAKS